MSERRIVGIDLGTTHCAMSRIEDGQSQVIPVTQLVAKGQIGTATLLPSFLAFAHESEGPCALPWDAERSYAVGEYARSRGVETPARVVSSAKSWLCHAGVDRRSSLLPLKMMGVDASLTDDIERISPVEASYRYLEHLAESYADAFPGESLSECDVVLTVPASFDASARELTAEAAMAAGLDHLTIVEEPQAALYAWLEAMGDGFRKALTVGDVLLVVDVGGGTTDFSAIEVKDDAGNLDLHRIAVGDHILLGGDNMDLAVSHLARQKLVASGKEIDRLQMTALTHASRSAKERLLSDPSLASAPVSIAGRGSQLIGNTLRTELLQAEVTAALVEGFFPLVERGARPAVRTRAGLRELGLPFATDAAVTRHLAAFLAKQASARAGGSDLLAPTKVLFNGGVMKSDRLKRRVLDVLAAWVPERAPEELGGADLDHAVCRGAAYYGLVRRGKGLRIKGGTARSYYIGIESAVPAVPGVEPPMSALCVAPFGMEEGSEAALPPDELGVVVGETVRFRFFGSSSRRDDRAGTEIDDVNRPDLDELPPIEVVLPSEGRTDGDVVPVRLAASVTEVGTLLIEAVPVEPRVEDERWKVELSVRGEP